MLEDSLTRIRSTWEALKINKEAYGLFLERFFYFFYFMQILRDLKNFYNRKNFYAFCSKYFPYVAVPALW